MQSVIKPQPQQIDKSLYEQCPMRILVVEDNQINLKVLEKTLNRMGYTSDVSRNGLEAVEATRSNSYDLVFMDLRMPIMGGIEAARTIRETLKEKTPLIAAFTANTHHSDQLACKDVGMFDFISKPTTPQRIEEVIRNGYSIHLKNSKEAH